MRSIKQNLNGHIESLGVGFALGSSRLKPCPRIIKAAFQGPNLRSVIARP